MRPTRPRHNARSRCGRCRSRPRHRPRSRRRTHPIRCSRRRTIRYRPRRRHDGGARYDRRMCLIAVAWRVHPRYELALVANRDDSHARPAAPAGVDPEAADVYGGRDLQAGGSWLQVSTRGRLAAVTNVRTGLRDQVAPRSRGALVRDFVRGAAPAPEYLEALAETAGDYAPYNLLAWDGGELSFASNHTFGQPRHATHLVAPGVHAMSNGAFDAPWPKSGHATRALSAWLASPASHGEP